MHRYELLLSETTTGREVDEYDVIVGSMARTLSQGDPDDDSMCPIDWVVGFYENSYVLLASVLPLTDYAHI